MEEFLRSHSEAIGLVLTYLILTIVGAILPAPSRMGELCRRVALDLKPKIQGKISTNQKSKENEEENHGSR